MEIFMTEQDTAPAQEPIPVAPVVLREPYARMSVLENNRRSLQVLCHAAIEDMAEAVNTHGAESPHSEEVKARYVRLLTRDFPKLLAEAITSLDLDHAWPRHV